MSTYEKRYLVGDDFDGAFYIDEQEGVRTAKIVKMRHTDLLWGCRSQMSVEEWDRLPRTPQEAKDDYIKKKIEDIAWCSRRSVQCFDEIAKANKLEPVARKRKERC